MLRHLPPENDVAVKTEISLKPLQVKVSKLSVVMLIF